MQKALGQIPINVKRRPLMTAGEFRENEKRFGHSLKVGDETYVPRFDMRWDSESGKACGCINGIVKQGEYLSGVSWPGYAQKMTPDQHNTKRSAAENDLDNESGSDWLSIMHETHYVTRITGTVA